MNKSLPTSVTQSRTHTHPTFKYMTWWEFGIAHFLLLHMLLIKREIYLQDKQHLGKEFARTAPGPALQHFATLLYFFIFSEFHPRLKS